MAETDNLIREVDEEIRREKLLRLWDQFGIYLVGVAAIIVLGIGGYRYMEYQRTQNSGAAGARYQAALQQLSEAGKQEEALKTLEAIGKDGGTGFATLAELRVAGAEAKKGRFDQAVAIYDKIAKQPSTDALLVGFAKLQAAMLRLGTADWTEMQNRLNDLRVDSSPYRASARELLGIAAYKAGKTDEARRTFEQLVTDKKAPQSVGDRARIMMLVLTEAEIAKSGGPAVKDKKSAAPAPGDKKDAAAPATGTMPGADKPAAKAEEPGKASATEKAPEPAKSAGDVKAEPAKGEPVKSEAKEADKAVPAAKTGESAPPASVEPGKPPETDAKK